MFHTLLADSHPWINLNWSWSTVEMVSEVNLDTIFSAYVYLSKILATTPLSSLIVVTAYKLLYQLRE